MNKEFKDLGLSEATLRALERLEYQSPTVVQKQAIPPALEKKDLAVAAKTGTGKTAAFALPIIQNTKARKGKQPQALIITPTRELAQQIESVLVALAHTSKHRVVTFVGGVSYESQMKKLRNGVDIVVATPGRLKDMIERKAIRLDFVSILVLDEADRMLDMGFLPAVREIVGKTPSTRQTLLFSATIDRKAMNITRNMMKDPQFIEVSHKGETADGIEQYIVPIAQNRKAELLCAVLKERGSERVIVFARTKSRSDMCANQLRRAGFQAEAIHSDLSQSQRRRALDNFKQGKTGILVATDVLARGIDVDDVEHVINYDLPDCADDYIHRIGRTGRAGKKGDAVTFVSFDAKSNLKEIERLVGVEIPFLTVEGFDCKREALALRKTTPPFKNFKGSMRPRSYRGRR
ncbi:MAG: DEAD/DEAH box helicase [Raoultibacter sp.]|jgi:ATP-dependent RNA helicase RhlE